MLLDRRVAAVAFTACLQAASWACSSRISSVPPQIAKPDSPATVECAVVAEPGDPVAIVALTDRIDPANAPHPSNESERLLFRQVYESLVRVDCMGRVLPGLAASWRLDADGRAWIVTLRENARFSDGTPVTAAEVRTSWTLDGAGDALQPRVSRLVESIVPLDDRTLTVTLRRPGAEAPRVLAHTDLAVARPAAASRWPLGTRLSPIRFLDAAGDPRDLLDTGVDLLVTRDPATRDYAATLSQFQSVPLAWNRTHVLLSPGGARTAPALSDEARQALADDAVRGEARGALGPFWWQTLPDCEAEHAHRGAPPSLTPRIVYDGGDAVARDLAERFVGLARASYQRAAGLTGEALAAARQRGTDAAYIVSLDSRPIDPCRELQVLIDSARWLDPEAIVPLVDTRQHAILRRGRSGVRAEWDGGLLLGDEAAREKQ